jgi:hypothetical protein
VLSEASRTLLVDIFRRPPESFTQAAGEEVKSLEQLHRELIVAHLERDLRAPRVVRDATREAAR